MPAQSIPPIVLITAGVAGMGALQYGVHWIFKPSKVPSPPPPPLTPPVRPAARVACSAGTGDRRRGADGRAGRPAARTHVRRERVRCARQSRRQQQGQRRAQAAGGAERGREPPACLGSRLLCLSGRVPRRRDVVADPARPVGRAAGVGARAWRPGGQSGRCAAGLRSGALARRRRGGWGQMSLRAAPAILTRRAVICSRQTGPCSSAHTTEWTSGTTTCRTAMPG